MSAPVTRRNQILEARRLSYDAYDSCFCDDVGQDPLCPTCLHLRDVMAILDLLIARDDL